MYINYGTIFWLIFCNERAIYHGINGLSMHDWKWQRAPSYLLKHTGPLGYQDDGKHWSSKGWDSWFTFHVKSTRIEKAHSFGGGHSIYSKLVKMHIGIKMGSIVGLWFLLLCILFSDNPQLEKGKILYSIFQVDFICQHHGLDFWVPFSECVTWSSINSAAIEIIDDSI